MKPMLKQYLTPKYLNRLMITGIIIYWLIVFLSSYRHGVFNFEEAVKGTGGLAWYLLLFVIFVSLAQKIARLHLPKVWLFAVLLPLRKWAGIFAFLVVVSHSLFQMLDKGIATNISEIIKTAFSTEHAMIFGALAFLIMLPLFLTSTNWAVKRMGYKSWKNLQRLVHIAFVFAAVHVTLINFFSRGEIEFGPLILLVIYGGGYFYLWVRKLQASKTA